MRVHNLCTYASFFALLPLQYRRARHATTDVRSRAVRCSVTQRARELFTRPLFERALVIAWAQAPASNMDIEMWSHAVYQRPVSWATSTEENNWKTCKQRRGARWRVPSRRYRCVQRCCTSFLCYSATGCPGHLFRTCRELVWVHVLCSTCVRVCVSRRIVLSSMFRWVAVVRYDSNENGHEMFTSRNSMSRPCSIRPQHPGMSLNVIASISSGAMPHLIFVLVRTTDFLIWNSRPSTDAADIRKYLKNLLLSSLRRGYHV
jgi:hypothetical protein